GRGCPTWKALTSSRICPSAGIQKGTTMTNYYWHFVQVDEHGTPRLGYGDGRAVVVGETLRVDAEPILCSVGLHASRRLWDALKYAQGDRLSLCRVTLGGTVVDDDDKSVASERTVIAMLT